jgi:hypothetical protein
MEEFAPYARGRRKRQGAGRELRRAVLASGVLCWPILGGAASAGRGSGFAAAAIGDSGFRPRFAMRDVLVESPWTKRPRSNRQSRWPDISKGDARAMSVLNIDRLIGLHLGGKLDAATASMAKYWVTDLENKIVDECLQLFGGYGYMS